MPDLRPFRGLRYDAARVPDLSSVLCPPYDVISAAERQRLLNVDRRNAVRLELPSATPESATEDDFRSAAATLDEWLSDGTLSRDDRPLIYVYEQQYVDGEGAALVARSFFCELLLEDYGPDSGIRPHEHTLGPAKEHRFRLLSAVRTHLSPVLLIYESDSTELLDTIVASARPREATGPNGVGQRLWTIDPELVPEANDLLALAGSRPLTIADGHHRYETALRYRDTPGAAPGADHVMALLYSGHSNGLALAPWHRIISDSDSESATANAASLYDVTRVKSSDELLVTLHESAQAGIVGVWSRGGGSVLRVDRNRAQPFVSGFPSDAVRWLDVSVLSGTLPQMIGTTEAQLAAAHRLTYTHDVRAAIAAVDSGAAEICFLLRPTPIDDVIAVAAAGDFMPPKSTYFYPKAATGPVFDPLF